MKKKADTLFFNGTIYTVDTINSIVKAVVVGDGRIVYAGNEKDARENFDVKNEVDLKGKFMYPGFIDPHCHFYGYATDLIKADLTGTKSWEEVLGILKAHAAKHPEGWLLARGWDQNDWKVKEYPTGEELDSLFPDRPVLLIRIDGHAAIANKIALQLAGITATTHVPGGEVKINHGKPTGLLIDNAMDLVAKKVPALGEAKTEALLMEAQKNCFSVGLTTLSDAGLGKEVIFLLDKLQKQGKLKMRIYAMVTDKPATKAYFYQHGPYKTDRLNVYSFKYYSDGALGSRGACLKQPYTDEPGSNGLLLNSPDYFLAEAKKCYEHGFQMNTHCIGDSGNAEMLKIYGEVLKGKNDRRWRIEHCQVLDTNDIALFGKYSIIPSVQTTHATSDMYWVESRLGKERMKGAYAYRDLLKQNGLVANGSDFPVESINPLFGFYAAVTRKDQSGYPEGGFQKENALTRDEALRAMTIWAAFANFEEKEKGSLEKGKFADFTILNDDIMNAPDSTLFKIKVLQTWVNGEPVYSAH